MSSTSVSQFPESVNQSNHTEQLVRLLASLPADARARYGAAWRETADGLSDEAREAHADYWIDMITKHVALSETDARVAELGGK